MRNWFRGLSKGTKIGMFSVLGVFGIATAAPSPQRPEVQQLPVMSHCTSVITLSTKTEAIPHKSQSINDTTLPKGQTKTRVTGVDGQEAHKYKDTKFSPSGCSPDKNELVESTVTKSPIDEVIVVGTYITPPAQQPSCPNGTYTNSAGNLVCSPYNSSSVPQGATAQCSDDSYSYSQSRSGTCSHHGGVLKWL